MTIKQKEFLKEFRELLIKYHAEIDWTCDDCSDTYGLCDDHLYISMYGQKDIDFKYNGIDITDIDYLLKEGDEENE